MDHHTVIPQDQLNKLIINLLNRIAEKGVAIDSAYLYGSYAHGAPSWESDIDVAIVSSDLSGFRPDDYARLNVIASKLDARFEVIGFRPEQFVEELPLVGEILRSGIPLAVPEPV